MRIKFSPQRREEALSVVKSGEALTLNGEALDFAALPDGASLPREAIACPWIAGDVERVSGELIVPLVLPLGPHPSPEAAFPADLVDVADGNVELPQ